MTDDQSDPLRSRFEERIGKPLGAARPAEAPDEVNLAMIRHWVDALDDRNPVYLDPELAATRFGGVVAPPAMLQTWTMPRPRIEGIAERGGAPGEIGSDNPLSSLDEAGYTGTVATNSELEFERYLRPGDRVRSSIVLEAISNRKATALGLGYFVTWLTTYTDGQGEAIGRQRFRILKFQPAAPRGGLETSGQTGSKQRSENAVGEELPPFDLPVTATVIVAGAIASRDFMPAHHDRDFAMAQGAPDIFMNILTTNGYVSRFVTDWAGADAMLRSISIRLGAPAVPGQTLRFTGQVAGTSHAGDERVVEVVIRAANELGAHATGTVVLTLPLDEATA